MSIDSPHSTHDIINKNFRRKIINIHSEIFGTFNGQDVYKYTLSNRHAIRVEVLTFGASLKGIFVPDIKGKISNVVLSLPTLEDYIADTAYIGRTIGPVANRISQAKFNVGSQQYELERNDGIHCLHSGNSGLHNKIWHPTASVSDDKVSLTLTSEHLHLEGGFPGNKLFSVTYSLEDDNKLSIYYCAKSDMLTPISLTNHAYFNLSEADNVLGHELYIDADHFMPTDDEFIPTKEVTSLADSPFDFRKLKIIGKDINSKQAQLEYACGYNHNYVLMHREQISALLSDKESGRTMALLTDMPGIQLYTGNYLQLMKDSRGAFPFKQYAGVCLEAQNPPNSPNLPYSPSMWMAPSKPYKAFVSLQFSLSE